MSPNTSDPKSLRRCTADAPAGPRSRRFTKWVPLPTTMTSEQKHGNIGLRCCKLQPAGSHHRHLAGLGDNGRRRSIAQGILDHGEHRCIRAGLCVDDVGGPKSCLFQGRSVEVVAAAYPQDWLRQQPRFPRSNSGKEQSCRSVVHERTAACGGFMQCAGPKPTAQRSIQRVHSKRHAPEIRKRSGQFAQLFKGCDRGRESKRHDGETRIMFFICSHS